MDRKFLVVGLLVVATVVFVLTGLDVIKGDGLAWGLGAGFAGLAAERL